MRVVPSSFLQKCDEDTTRESAHTHLHVFQTRKRECVICSASSGDAEKGDDNAPGILGPVESATPGADGQRGERRPRAGRHEPASLPEARASPLAVVLFLHCAEISLSIRRRRRPRRTHTPARVSLVRHTRRERALFEGRPCASPLKAWRRSRRGDSRGAMRSLVTSSPSSKRTRHVPEAEAETTVPRYLGEIKRK